MSGLTKCLNHTCPLRETCLRAKVEDSNFQPYTKIQPDPITGKCAAYLHDYGDAGHSSYPTSEN